MTTTTTPKAGPPASPPPADAAAPLDFIRQIVADDLAAGRHRRIVTRFPPEPNGYLHIGHAKSICLNFGIARENAGGRCNLRFDDTNPTTEDVEYVEAIEENVRWLGFDWDGLYFASDYFERFYGWAVELIEAGKAYVDHLSEDEIRVFRGTVTEPGRESPYRGRSVAENLDLFTRMRAGEFPDGACVLRAKIDMASANMKMRDPLLYRIRHAHHYRTGDAWPIYPMYDWAHPLSDAIEGITHSLCTLEFENNRELYDWVVGNTSVPSRPRQIEFARLNLTHTVMSKRKFLQLVERRLVSGWDDPRMPTLAGLRRRGYTPEAIRTFCDRIGVAKSNSTVDVAQLEHAVREDLNQRAPRVLAVLRPLKVVVDNYPEGEVEELEAPSWPADVPREGSRKLPFSRELLIERDDFREDPPKGFYRLSPGAEVRLRYAYLVRCVGVVRDEASGEPVEVHCTYDPATRGGAAPDGRRVRGTIHWLSAAHAVPVEVRLYDRLFRLERPDLAENAGLEELINPDSIEVVRDAWIEPAAAAAEPGSHVQFERHGYFFADPVDSRPGAPVFNRVVALRDSWAKVEKGEVGRDEAASAGGEGPARTEARDSPAPAADAAPGPLRPVLDDPLALRFRDELGLAEADAALVAADPRLAALFEEAVALYPNPRGLANWIVNELLRELKGREGEAPPVAASGLAELVAMIDAGTVSTTAAKEVFAEMVAGGGEPRRIVAARGLEQVADREALGPLVDEVLAGHPAEVAAFRAGKESLAGFFVGRVMKSSGGRADPRLVGELVRERLTLAGGG